MRDSAERVQFIADYLSSYKTKIESLNKNGLFDSATLYELFASEVCRLWFGQAFKNLNTVRSNYPYVDLVSEDEAIYVQVSTGQDIPGKVKSTLEKIKNSKDRSFSQIKTLYFFVLGNDSIDDIPEYTGEGRIGNIDFQPESHLISIAKIISKATTDLEFQQSLYNLLHRESETFRTTAEKFEEMLADSGALIRTQIDDLINGEYEISRNDLMSKIQSEDFRFITILGDAGSGKSALCKKLVSGEELVLFARAEKIAEVTDIDDIWNLSVNQLLHYLNGKKIIFYIDALEFIADGRKTNIDLLQSLYEVSQNHKDAHILTSCRTSDKNAFLRLTSAYDIQEYKVPELTDPEIAQVATKYPIIRDLWQQNRYAELLKSPFYLNIIVKQIKSVDDLSGTNGLREFIWDNVICLKNKLLPAGVTSDNVRDAVNTIVFTRAKDFSIGIPKDDVPNHVLKALLSNGVVIQTSSKLRLTYDIFEDICFEQRFDREFDGCKGDFCAFFTNLCDLGRCVYRRYQIWVENKLFIKEGRESFLYSLVFSDNIPDDWKKQTIIGITKSGFCKDFFAEYGQDLIERNLIAKFFEITNLYSFEARIITRPSGNHYAFSRPIGVGREQLIQLSKEKCLFEKTEYKNAIIKLCTDYAKRPLFDEPTAKAACVIFETYIAQKLEETEKFASYSIGKEVLDYLHSLYFMAEFCTEWLRDFWVKTLADYKTHSRSLAFRLAEDIIEDVFKNSTRALANTLPLELMELAWAYWVEKPSQRENLFQHSFSTISREENFGLNDNASHYSYVFKTPEENTFLHYLTFTQFDHALCWAIKITNYVANYMQSKTPGEIHTIKLIEFPKRTEYTYLVCPDFSFAGVQEFGIPTLVGDIVYTIRKYVFKHINDQLSTGDEEYCVRFTKWIKKEILQKSNNTILLDLLEDIGLQYPALLPGYSVLFASSIEFVMNDTQRQLAQWGYGNFLRTRYSDNDQPILSLCDYILKTQLSGHPEGKELCEKTLDYLYSIVPNDTNNAVQHLQIQKMDIRRAKVIQNGNECYLLPQISGAAQAVTEDYENSESYKNQNIIAQLENQYKDANNGCNLSLDDCIIGLEELEIIFTSSEDALFAEGAYIKYISCALCKDELDMESRSRYCAFWINGLNRIINNGTFAYNKELTHILFEQTQNCLTDAVKVAFKRLLLDIILSDSENGFVSELKLMLKHYLASNEHWADLLFNTVLELAKDEMAHNLYNANYAMRYFGDEITEYHPNLSPSLSGVDYHIKIRGDIPYKSHKEEIIQKHLLMEEDNSVMTFDIKEYDISLLCHLASCGLSVANERVFLIMKAIVHQLIEIWYEEEKSNIRDEVLHVYDSWEVSSFLKDELLNPGTTDLVIDLLLHETDYSKFTSNALEFYEEILIGYLPQYFDAYNNASERRRYKSIAEKIESNILRIPDGKAQIQLYRVLFLPSTGFYCGDWSNCKTSYSYPEKQFINSLWEKYGQYHLKGLLMAIYELHTRELLPEVLPAICLSFSNAKEQATDSVAVAISQSRVRINEIITTAFAEKEDQIKSSSQLTAAFESFLGLLIEFNFEMAAVTLDEFRIH